MYFDQKRNRVLLRDGSSVLSPDEYARRVLLGKDVTGLHAIRSDESDAYDLIYHTTVGKDITDIDVSPDSHIATDEQIRFVINSILNSTRYSPYMDDRLALEIDYFRRTNNITFLAECITLVGLMKEQGVIWGVGRGSACASLVMYLIEVNDVNPLTFNIPFEELSKEQDL